MSQAAEESIIMQLMFLDGDAKRCGLGGGDCPSVVGLADFVARCPV